MTFPELEFVKEDRFGYLIEKDPFEVAFVSTNRQIEGFYSVVSSPIPLNYVALPPQYVPRDYPGAKFMKVRGRRIGRTLDILLDDPKGMSR